MKKKAAKPLPVVFDRVTPGLLEVMPYEFPGRPIDITIETEEFTCLCPWSGLPDYALLTIKYVPDMVVVELKSLKMYLQSYRMVGMVHESVVNRLLKDLVAVVGPVSMSVELVFNIRGGISTTVRAEYAQGK